MRHSEARIKMFVERFGESKAKEILDNYYDLIFRFGGAVSNFAASGFNLTPKEKLEERESICRTCDQWDAEALNKTGRCRKCGCSTWAKLRMATERCPLGKWEAVIVEDSNQ
jgi:predicted Zn-ribbon and HTH transcriptional regulator